MRRLIGVLLLLVQLGPVAGAGLCLHKPVERAEHCATPMEGMAPGGTDQSHHGTPQDCAQLAVCAPPAPVVPQVALQAFGADLPATTLYSNPPALLLGDPIAPPQPPPIV